MKCGVYGCVCVCVHALAPSTIIKEGGYYDNKISYIGGTIATNHSISEAEKESAVDSNNNSDKNDEKKGRIWRKSKKNRKYQEFLPKDRVIAIVI